MLKVKSFFTAFCSYLFLATSFNSQAYSDELKVGLAELDYPPFYYVGDDAMTGASIEIAEALADIAGHQLTYKRVPWKRLQKELQSGSLDMVILYMRTEERERDVFYTQAPYIFEESYLFVGKDHELTEAQDLKQLSGYDFFYVRGYSHGEAFDSASYLHKTEVKDELELIKRISSDRPFIGVGSKPAIIYHAQQSGLGEEIKFLQPALHRGENFMAVSRQVEGGEKIAADFSAAFTEFSKRPVYSEILRRYGF